MIRRNFLKTIGAGAGALLLGGATSMSSQPIPALDPIKPPPLTGWDVENAIRAKAEEFWEMGVCTWVDPEFRAYLPTRYFDLLVESIESIRGFPRWAYSPTPVKEAALIAEFGVVHIYRDDAPGPGHRPRVYVSAKSWARCVTLMEPILE